MDDVTWGALALTLTLLGGLWSWWAYTHRGVVAGARGVGLTLLAPAAWLTGTLELVGDIATDVMHWASRLVFSPTVWLGVLLAGVSAVILVVTGFLGARESGTSREAGRPATPGTPRRPAVPPPVDDDLADIEELLRKRGIE